MSGPPPRFISPHAEGEFYWTSGADGVLRLQRCGACGRFNHPAGPVCPFCHSRDLAPAPVSGRGTIATFTINRKEWIPGFEPPTCSRSWRSTRTRRSASGPTSWAAASTT
ncbi:MAG: zinc ribbon domain-containing protein [Acidimicrobiales bacterium]